MAAPGAKISSVIPRPRRINSIPRHVAQDRGGYRGGRFTNRPDCRTGLKTEPTSEFFENSLWLGFFKPRIVNNVVRSRKCHANIPSGAFPSQKWCTPKVLLIILRSPKNGFHFLYRHAFIDLDAIGFADRIAVREGKSSAAEHQRRNQQTNPRQFSFHGRNPQTA